MKSPVISSHDRVFKSLGGIRDRVILLGLGNAYLCEEPFLRRSGLAMEVHLDTLRGDIAELKKQFPGKFERELDTDEIVGLLRTKALHLKDPDREIIDRCTIGDLEKELDDLVHSLTVSVRAVRAQVEGSPPAYTKKDSFLDLFGWLKSLGEVFSFLSGRFLKWALVLLLAAGVAFSVLFLSLERATPLQERIRQSEAAIQNQEAMLSDISLQREELLLRIEALKGAEQTRRHKVEIMDLYMQIQDLEDKENELQEKIAAQEAIIRENREKLDDIEEKSLVERLLRM
jgi:hypothetical protein